MINPLYLLQFAWHEMKYHHEGRVKDGVGRFLVCKPRLFGEYRFLFTPDSLDEIVYEIEPETAYNIIKSANSSAEAVRMIADSRKEMSAEGEGGKHH